MRKVWRVPVLRCLSAGMLLTVLLALVKKKKKTASVNTSKNQHTVGTVKTLLKGGNEVTCLDVLWEGFALTIELELLIPHTPLAFVSPFFFLQYFRHAITVESHGFGFPVTGLLL